MKNYNPYNFVGLLRDNTIVKVLKAPIHPTILCVYLPALTKPAESLCRRPKVPEY